MPSHDKRPGEGFSARPPHKVTLDVALAMDHQARGLSLLTSVIGMVQRQYVASHDLRRHAPGALGERRIAATADHPPKPGDAMSQPDIEPAQVFEDRMYAGEWRVQWFDDHGDCEVPIFSGPKSRERAIQYAERQYGLFAELRFDP
jgi:hypothetical protein